jgi:hypothetical protein
MRRLCVLAGFLLVLASGAGCVGPQEQAKWDAAMKDLRGENSRMGSAKSGL